MLTLLSGNEAWHSQLQRLDRFVVELKRHLPLDWDLLLYLFCSHLPFQCTGGLRCFPDSFHLWILSNAHIRCQQILSSASCPLNVTELTVAVVNLTGSMLKESVIWLFCLHRALALRQHRPKRRVIFNFNKLMQKESVLCLLPSLHNFSPDKGLHTKYNERMNYFSCVPVVFLIDICVCLFLAYKMQLSFSLKYTCEIKNMLSQLAA